MEVGGQRHGQSYLSPGETRYQLYRRLGVPQGRSKRVRKISPPPGLDSLSVQLVASCYTDRAVPARKWPVKDRNMLWQEIHTYLFVSAVKLRN